MQVSNRGLPIVKKRDFTAPDHYLPMSKETLEG